MPQRIETTQAPNHEWIHSTHILKPQGSLCTNAYMLCTLGLYFMTFTIPQRVICTNLGAASLQLQSLCSIDESYPCSISQPDHSRRRRRLLLLRFKIQKTTLSKTSKASCIYKQQCLSKKPFRSMQINQLLLP